MRKKILLAAVAPAVLSLALAGCQQGKSPTQKEEANREWNGARSAVLASLANEQYKSGNFDKCRRTLDEALRLTPDSAALHLLSAKLAIETGKLELAENELKVARQYNPNDPEAYYFLGVVYQRWQKPQVALDLYKQASAKAPAELAYLLAQAEMLVAMNRSSEALDLLQGKVTYFEHSGAIRDAVGQLLMEAGRWTDAAAMLREASILSEDDNGIRERLAIALYHTKEYREAADILSRLVASDAYAKRADLFTVLGQCQLNIGKAREARYSFETATELDPYNAHTWQCLGRAALETADLRRAEMSLARSIKLDPSCGETHLLQGYVHLRRDHLAVALAEFRKATTIDQRDTVSLCMVGYALQKMGKPQQAIQYYAKALRIKPGDDMASQLIAGVDVDK
jgi:tetratricopeptide (TPR) repeat protein